MYDHANVLVLLPYLDLKNVSYVNIQIIGNCIVHNELVYEIVFIKINLP